MKYELTIAEQAAVDRIDELQPAVIVLSQSMREGMETLLPKDASPDVPAVKFNPGATTGDGITDGVHRHVATNALEALPKKPFQRDTRNDAQKLSAISRYTVKNLVAQDLGIEEQGEAEALYDAYPLQFDDGVHIGALHMLFGSYQNPHSVRAEVVEWNQKLAVAAITTWLGSAHKMPTVLSHLEQVWSNQSETIERKDMYMLQLVLQLHMINAYHVVVSIATNENAPWEWQETLCVGQLVDELGDQQAFDDLWETVKTVTYLQNTRKI